MIKLSRVIAKVIPKLQKIEEDPVVSILEPVGTPANTNPFAASTQHDYLPPVTIPVVYSEQPEVVMTGNNINTSQQLYFYIQKKDYDLFTLKHRFIFNHMRYRPIELQELFQLWKIKVVKE